MNVVETGMELSFGRCMFSLLKFGGIGLFTCKMTLYTYYMQSVEPNATKLYGI